MRTIESKTIYLIQNERFKSGRDVSRGVFRYAQVHRKPWNILRYHVEWEPALEHDFLKWEHIDGVIMVPTDKLKAGSIKQPSPFPIVVTAYEDLIPSFPQVGVHGFSSGKMAAEYFVQKGFKSFLCVEAQDDPERWNGYKQTLDRMGFKSRHCSLKILSTQTENKENCINTLAKTLHQMPKPVALYCETDPLASTLIPHLQREGFHIPNDVAILATGDDDLTCNSSSPNISSIKLPHEEVGYEAARLMDLALSGKALPAAPVWLDPVCVTERQSSDVIAFPDPHIQKALLYIKNRACGPIKVEEVARASGLSLRVLQKDFRKALGYSLQEEIQRTRIRRAKELLRNTSRSLDEITDEIGYSNRNYLNNAFKASVGITPGNYRKQFKT